MAAWTVDYFGPELLTKDGLKPTAEALAGKTRIGIYFSAHWVSSIFPSVHFHYMRGFVEDQLGLGFFINVPEI